MSTIIKDERKVFRKRYGVPFFLDAIRTHHTSSTEVSEEENKTIRVSLLGLVKFYLQKECNIKELSALLGFLSTVREEILVSPQASFILVFIRLQYFKNKLEESKAFNLIYIKFILEWLRLNNKPQKIWNFTVHYIIFIVKPNKSNIVRYKKCYKEYSL